MEDGSRDPGGAGPEVEQATVRMHHWTKHDAIKQSTAYLEGGCRFIVEIDLAKFLVLRKLAGNLY